MSLQSHTSGDVQTRNNAAVRSQARRRSPLPKIVLHGERHVFALGNTAKGKVLFHSRQRHEIQAVNIALMVGSRTRKVVDMSPSQENSPHFCAVVSTVLFAKEKTDRVLLSCGYRNTTTWDFHITIPSHSVTDSKDAEVAPPTWALNDTFIDPKGILELPPTFTGNFCPNDWEQSTVYMNVDYHLEATITYLNELGQSMESLVVEPIVLDSPKLPANIISNSMPLIKPTNVLVKRMNRIIRRKPDISKYGLPQLLLERRSIASTSLYLRSADVVSGAKAPFTRSASSPRIVLHQATMELIETINTRTAHRQTGLMSLGEQMYSTSRTAVISKDGLYLPVPSTSAENPLNLEHAMEANFANAIASFHPTIATVNIKISHHFVVSLKFKVDGERCSLRLEQSFKVLKEMPARGARVNFVDMSVNSRFRQDSAVDGVLCGDDLRHPFAEPKWGGINMQDGDGVYRKDWSIW